MVLLPGVADDHLHNRPTPAIKPNLTVASVLARPAVTDLIEMTTMTCSLRVKPASVRPVRDSLASVLLDDATSVATDLLAADALGCGLLDRPARRSTDGSGLGWLATELDGVAPSVLAYDEEEEGDDDFLYGEDDDDDDDDDDEEEDEEEDDDEDEEDDDDFGDEDEEEEDDEEEEEEEEEDDEEFEEDEEDEEYEDDDEGLLGDDDEELDEEEDEEEGDEEE